MNKNVFILRDYQQCAVDAGLDFLLNGKEQDRPIIVAPTGAGKSIYAANLASQLGSGVLVLQPSKELLEQNYAKFKAYGGRASIYSASMGSKKVGNVTFATIGSIVKKADLFGHKKYVIIDECHLVPPNPQSMYMMFFKRLAKLPNAKDIRVLGLTATPFRLKKYNDPFTGMPFSKINLLPRELPRFFNKFLYVTQIDELYEKKFLAPINYIPMEWSNGDLKVNTTGAEFTDESIDKALQMQGVHERLPRIISQSLEKGRKHRLVFVKSVQKAIELSQNVPDSACVHSETKKKERESILYAFKAGEIKTVFNVGVLTVGFDFPALDTIIIARPTMSLALYMQMIGRGVRTCEGKENCAVVEMCGNFTRFGKPDDIRYLNDPKKGWIIHNGERQLSGVRLDEYGKGNDSKKF